MPEAYCDCCDLPVSMCTRADQDRARVQEAAETRAWREQALARPGVVAASYPGACATCRTRYSAADPIRRTEDGWSAVACCPEVVGA